MKQYPLEWSDSASADQNTGRKQLFEYSQPDPCVLALRK